MVMYLFAPGSFDIFCNSLNCDDVMPPLKFVLPAVNAGIIFWSIEIKMMRNRSGRGRGLAASSASVIRSLLTVS